MEKRLIRSCYVGSTIVDGKIVFSDWDNSLPEVEVNMDYVLNTTDEEFLKFPENKVLLMTDKVHTMYADRYYEIRKKEYKEKEILKLEDEK